MPMALHGPGEGPLAPRLALDGVALITPASDGLGMAALSQPEGEPGFSGFASGRDRRLPLLLVERGE
jgi:hypothetical protein